MDTVQPSLAKRLQESGVARGGHAYDLVNRRRIPNHALAIRIFKATGVKLGPLEQLSDDVVRALAEQA